MLITEEKTVKKFKDVGIGEVIRFVDGICSVEFAYMVIAECHEEDGDLVNLVCLNDGTLLYADDEENVEVLNTELIIKK